MRFDKSYLDRSRKIGDQKADQLIDNVFSQHLERDLYGYLKLPDCEVPLNENPSIVRDFLLENRELPEWYDPERIKNGQAVFRKYATDIMTLLGALSLPYCYAASPGNKAIYLTEKMRNSPGMRLLDTAQFIISVMKDRCFEGSREGYIQINKTRLIHAMVRYYLQTKSKWNNEWGVPVNQEDMAGTNLAFSYIILDGLQRFKFPVSEGEMEDFLYIWRFIGYNLSIDEELLPTTYNEANQLEEAIKKRHIRKSSEGEALINDLIKHYKSAFPLIPSYFVDGQIRYFLGSEISGMLGMKPQPLKDGIVYLMNGLKERINKKFIDPSSYKKMLKNHEVLKAKYR